MVGGAEGEFKLSPEEIEAQEIKKAQARVNNAENIVTEDWGILEAAYQRACESTFSDDGEGVWNVMEALLRQAGQESIIEEGVLEAYKEAKLAEGMSDLKLVPGSNEGPSVEEDFPEEKIA